MSIESILEGLKKTVLFRNALPEEVESIAEYVEISEFDDGDQIFAEGSPGNQLYMVLQGAVEISKQSPGGSAQPIASIPANAVFGEIAFLTGSQRTASASASGATRLAALPSESFRTLLSEGDRAATSLLLTLSTVLSSRLTLMGEELVKLADEERTEGGNRIAEISDLRRRLLTEWNF